MNRFFALCRLAQAYRPFIKLALVAGGVLVMAMAGGAPECWPDDPGC